MTQAAAALRPARPLRPADCSAAARAGARAAGAGDVAQRVPNSTARGTLGPNKKSRALQLKALAAKAMTRSRRS